jgi:hypothetical protein
VATSGHAELPLQSWISALSWFGTQNVELRLEAFNLLNNINWGNLVTQHQEQQLRTDSDDGRGAAYHAVRGRIWVLATVNCEL